MRRSAYPKIWLAGLLAVTAAPAANAHEYWLSPSRYRAAAGDTVEVSAWVGTGFRGESRPFSAARARKLLARGPKEVDLLPATAEGAPIFARFRPADDRGLLVAYESGFASITLRAAEFDEYLALEGLDEPLRARRARDDTTAGRERYARCAKTWIGFGEMSRLTTPVGMPFELVPLGDPTRSDTLRIRALYAGRPLAGVLVRAWRQPLAGSGDSPVGAAIRDSVGPTAEARTGADGVAALLLLEGGEWLVSGVHMVPAAAVANSAPGRDARGGAAADWESYWASITFARPR
jgi:uncharacterized GH25 family protein